MRKAPAVNAVERAQVAGVATEGSFPADTVLFRAKNGAFDAVLTMYHQDQIAVKLMGFDQTLLGGFGFPTSTPAHGTAYDIAGEGIAGIGATRAAVLLAADMAHGKKMDELISKTSHKFGLGTDCCGIP